MRFLMLLAALLAASTIAHAAPPLEAYGRLPAVEFMEISPQGGRIAMVVRQNGGQRLMVTTAAGVVELQNDLGAQNVRGLNWAGEDRLVLMGSANINAPAVGLPRQEWMGAAVLNLKTGAAKAIFEKSRHMLQAVFGWYGVAETDGRWYAYVGGVTYDQIAPRFDPAPTQPDLYRVDLDTGAYELISSAGAGDSDWAIRADGSVAARSFYDARGEVFQVRADAKGGETLMTLKSKDVSAAIAGLGRGADRILIRETGAAGVILREIGPGGGEGEVLSKGDNTAYGLWDPKSLLLIGLVLESGSRITLFDPALQQRADVTRRAFKTKRSRLASWDQGMNHMIAWTDGAGDSGTYWTIDIPGKSAKAFGFEYPRIQADDVGVSRMFAYKAADGLALEGALTLPIGREAKGAPLVILPHGGPITYGDHAGFDWIAQAFASRGYVVLQPNYRGTLGYGDAFRQAASGEWGRKMQTDLSDGVAALAAAGLVDPKRVCIVGASYGGYAALAGVTLQKDIYRCAVSFAGVSDLPKQVAWVSARQQGDSRARKFWADLMGATSGPIAAEISPARRADAASAPILLIHGVEDTVVPLEQSRFMERALKSSGKPVETIVLPGEDHWLSSEPTRIAMIQAAVAFVEKHNPPN